MSALLPVYYQIKQSIKNSILHGEYKPGEKIPSENELAKQFGVSRLTARQGVLQLVQEGFLATKRGTGTFVTENESLISNFNLEFSGFIDDLFYQIIDSRTKSVQMARIAASGLIKTKLELESNINEVIQLKRVRFREDRIFAYTVNYLPLEIGLKISKEQLLIKPLLQVIEEDLGIKFGEAFQTIEASFANQEVAQNLEIQSGSPILYVERIMYDQKRKPVEIVQSSYRGDLYKYTVRLKNVRSKVRNIWVHQQPD
jgi:GntR family transcriptional regulator